MALQQCSLESHWPTVNSWGEWAKPISSQMDFWDTDKGIQHDFSHSQDTKATLLELDRTQLDPQDISSNNDESDIA